MQLHTLFKLTHFLLFLCCPPHLIPKGNVSYYEHKGTFLCSRVFNCLSLVIFQLFNPSVSFLSVLFSNHSKGLVKDAVMFISTYVLHIEIFKLKKFYTEVRNTHHRHTSVYTHKQHTPETLTWRHCQVSKQRCWFQWSRCYPRSLCQRPGCHGIQRHRGRRWSGKLLGSRADLQTHTRTQKEKKK